MGSSQHEVVLEASSLRVETTQGVEIVSDVSLEIRRGAVLGLVGESGSGKTTAAMALLGHARRGTRIASGTVMLAGKNLLDQDEAQLRRIRGTQIAYVPQDPAISLNPAHRVGKQVAEMLVVHQNGADRSQRVSEILESVRLPSDTEFLTRYPFELSGGQQQRIAIAMALICRPEVIVLDEPTTGLDVTTQARILSLIRDLSDATQTGFLYVSHDLAVIDNLADSVAVMYAGRVAEVGRRQHVFAQSAHPYTRLLLASVPRLSVRQELTGIAGTAAAPGRRPPGCSFHPRCPLVVPRCKEEDPPQFEVSSGHGARCWRVADVGFALPPGVPVPDSLVPSNGRVLEVSGIVASYGRRDRRKVVLDGVSLSLGSGECLALVGESGSGKTTLGRCIAGLHRPDSGTVLFAGRPLAPTAQARPQTDLRALQIVFQNPDRSLNPAETVADAIRRPLRLFGGELTKRTPRDAVAELLDQVRLPLESANKYPRDLSGGEKQRVAIARALAAEPAVLICDEITSSLDVSIQAAVIRLLNDLRSTGLSLLFITHNLGLVNAVADRIVVLESGRVCEEGEVSRVIASPQHPYTLELVTAAPEIHSGS